MASGLRLAKQGMDFRRFEGVAVDILCPITLNRCLPVITWSLLFVTFLTDRALISSYHQHKAILSEKKEQLSGMLTIL